MDWNLQPEPVGVLVAEVVPHVLRPRDLRVVLGDVQLPEGSGPRPGSFEETNFDEWFPRITPGVGMARDLRLYPWDPWVVGSIEAMDFTTATIASIGNLVSHERVLYAAGVALGTLGLTCSGSIASVGSTFADMYIGWNALIELPSVGDEVRLLLAQGDAVGDDYWGWIYTRQATGVEAVYTWSVDGVVSTSSTLALNLGSVTGAFWAGMGVDQVIAPTNRTYGQPYTSATTWVLGNRWYHMDEAPIHSAWADTARMVVCNGAMVKKASFSSTSMCTAVYTLPEYHYGTWTTETERLRSVTMNAEVLSPTVLALPWSVVSITGMSINSQTVATASYIESFEGSRVYLMTPLGQDTEVELACLVNDFEYVYRGYSDLLTGYQGCDLNWRHPGSVLHENQAVYVYAQPSMVQIPEYGWRVRPTRAHGVVHNTEQINSEAMQLLMHVGSPGYEAPDIIDLRTPIPPDGTLGKWNPDESFEGPAYPEAGVVVVQVPAGYENQARDVVGHSVAAGIIPLIEGV